MPVISVMRNIIFGVKCTSTAHWKFYLALKLLWAFCIGWSWIQLLLSNVRLGIMRVRLRVVINWIYTTFSQVGARIMVVILAAVSRCIMHRQTSTCIHASRQPASINRRVLSNLRIWCIDVCVRGAKPTCLGGPITKRSDAVFSSDNLSKALSE